MMRRLNTGSEQFSLELSALIDHAGLIAPEVQKNRFRDHSRGAENR